MRTFRTRVPRSVRVLGIDPSLTSTGWAYRGPDGAPVTGRIDTGPLRGPWRLAYIQDRLTEILDRCNPTHVAYEDYAMGIGGGRGGFGHTFHLGEAGGVMKSAIWRRGIDLILISPTIVKVVVVGRSGSKKKPVGKKDMMSALQKFNCHVAQNDEADACALMICGELKTGAPTIPQNARKYIRLDSLNGCETVAGKLQLIA